MQPVRQPKPDNGFSGALFGLIFIVSFGVACVSFVVWKGAAPPQPPTELEKILAAGEITVIIRNNAHCFYLYRDQPMGFEYDLAKAFAHYLGVSLNVKIADKWEGMIPQLQNGEGSFIAASLTILPERASKVLFADGYMTTQQHIIVHRNNREVKTKEDLAGKTVHVRKGTSYQIQLQKLKDEGLVVKVVWHEDTPTEELIRQVAEGQIEITIADRNIALLNRRYYPQVKLADPIKADEHIAWAVAPRARQLRQQINRFFYRIKANGQFQDIYDQYYGQVEEFDYVDLRTYHRRLQTRLPKYEGEIKTLAERFGFDWRLIAAQMYQESHFKPRARSHAGAHGLMQLTRVTANSLGVSDIYDAKQNMRAGVEHLRTLYDYYAEAPEPDRLYIALAAYNVGWGHVQDARRLAQKFKLDPNHWASLTYVLPLLRYRHYYQDTVYGYCRGTEPVDYVKHILTYYDILKRRDIDVPYCDPAGLRAALEGPVKQHLMPNGGVVPAP